MVFVFLFPHGSIALKVGRYYISQIFKNLNMHLFYSTLDGRLHVFCSKDLVTADG